jgi:hypothetical protein
MRDDLRVVAVGRRAAAPAHALEVVVRVVLPGPRVDAAEEEVARSAAARGGDALRQHLTEHEPLHELEQPRLELRLAADARAGMAHVHDRPRRRDDVDRAERAGVDRALAPDHLQDAVVGR